jgi:lipopolysaccharide transport system permease protein
LFASGLQRGTGCFVSYQHIISKVYFPRIVLALAEVLTALADFLLSFGILLAMAWYYGFRPTPRLVVLPFLMVMAMALALSVGLLLAALHARFRDVSNFLSYLIQFWFYATPVAYSASLVMERVPKFVATLYWLNPMTGVVEGFRWALLGAGRAPDWTLAASAFGTVVLLVIGSMLFLRTEHSIVDLV